jgi:hypothetical protein
MQRLVWLVVAIAVLAGGGVASYRWYDTHHISSEFRRTAAAICDPTTSGSDQESYLRSARLQVRTARDAALLNEIETMLRIDDATLDLIQHNGPSLVYEASSPDDFKKQLDENSARIHENGKQAFALWSDVRRQLNLPQLDSRH